MTGKKSKKQGSVKRDGFAKTAIRKVITPFTKFGRKDFYLGIWPCIVTAVIYFFLNSFNILWPLAFIFLVPLLLVIEQRQPGIKETFRLFWWAGMLGHIGKVYWLVYTMEHYGHIPLPLALLVFLLLVSALGAFWGAFGAMAYALRKYTNLPHIVLIPGGWVIMEWWLTWVLSGFPWLPIGNTLIQLLPVVQIADVFGVYAISMMALAGNVAVMMIVRFFRKQRNGFPIIETAVFVALFGAMLVYGLVRIPQIDKLYAQGKPIRVGLMQGNIDQLVKWRSSHRQSTFDIYRELSAEAKAKGAELLIMPETALPYWQKTDFSFSKRITSFATKYDAYALVTFPAKVPNDVDSDDEEERYKKHNAAYLFDPEGNPLGHSFKRKLVPFGEFLPVAPVILWLKDALRLHEARVSAGFKPAEEYRVIPYPPGGGNFGVAICYEVIFPAIVRKTANLGTNFMVTITNDSWFGDTSAPHQHVDMVALRSIETRRAFARAANTGVSCITDPAGRVLDATAVYKRALIVDDIRTMDIRSVYSKIGDLFVYIWLAVFAGFAVYGIVRARQNKGDGND